jgi:hypothetical protein
MGLVLADRVQETTTTTGTGTLTLGGAAAQCQSFAAGIGTANSTYYILLSGNGTDWETGLGTVGGSGPYTLARTSIFASSNSGSAISLTGTSTVFCDLPASQVNNAIVTVAPWTRPDVSTFSWVNQQSATSSQYANGPLVITYPASTDTNLHGLVQSVPGSSPWTITINLAFNSNATNTPFAGIIIYDGTKAVTMGVTTYNNGSLQVLAFTSVTASGSVPNPPNINSFWPWYGGAVWLRVNYDGTNLNFYTSSNGAVWQAAGSLTAATYLGTITRAGFFLSADSNFPVSASLYNWELTTGSGSSTSFTAQTSLSTGATSLSAHGFTSWDNQGTATLVDNAVGSTLLQPTSTGHVLEAVYKTAPSTPYTATALFIFPFPPAIGGGSGFFFGWRSSAGAFDGFTSNPSGINHTTWSSHSSYASYTSILGAFTQPMWCSLTDNGTTVTMACSADGANFTTIFSVAKSSGYLGATGYNQIAIGMDAYSSAVQFTVAKYSD